MIISGGKTYDAYELAVSIINSWEEFIKTNRIIKDIETDERSKYLFRS